MRRPSYKIPKYKMPKDNTASGEKFLSRMAAYLLISLILTISGLISVGSPVISLLISFGIIAAGDIIARSIMLAKEPTLKFNPKSIELEVNQNTILEEAMADKELNDLINEWELEDYQSDNEYAISPELELETDDISDKMLSKDKKYRPYKTNGKAVTYLLASIILFSMFAVPILEEVFDSSDPIWEDDEIVLDAGDESFEDAHSAASMSAEYLFEELEYEDYEVLYDSFDAEDADEIIEYLDWSGISYIELSTSTDYLWNFAVVKYLVTDTEDNNYLVAIHELIDEEGGYYTAQIDGIAICEDVINGDDASDYSTESLINKSHLMGISEKHFGNADVDGISILLWDPEVDDYKSDLVKMTEDMLNEG